MMARWTTATVVAATIATAGASVARANGNNSHTWISARAVEHLPEGKLKDLLSDPVYHAILLNGSMFPDGGYVIEDDYGEMAHWEPFLEAYRKWIARTFDEPYTHGPAAEHAAFLLGVASHGMADQVFDSQFMEIAEVYDADGWADGLLDGFDTATDVMLVADTGQYLELEAWVPAEEISEIFADELDYAIDPGALITAQDLLHRVVLSYPRETGHNDPDRVAEYRAQYPWASDNLMDPMVQGSPPCEAVAVAAYWQSVWFRLHEQTGPDLVVATVPGDGGGGHPTDSSTVESQAIVVFGRGMDASTINPQTVTVTDPDGVEHDVRRHFHYGDGTNVLRLTPMVDWRADTVYTVTLHPGIATTDGVELTDALSFSFTTAATGESPIPPCTDPTPFLEQPDIPDPPADPDPGPVASERGCAVAHGGATAVLPVLLWLGLLAGGWRRR